MKTKNVKQVLLKNVDENQKGKLSITSKIMKKKLKKRSKKRSFKSINSKKRCHKFFFIKKYEVSNSRRSSARKSNEKPKFLWFFVKWC